MKWLSFSRIVRLGLTNFWRNRWLSLVATLVMTLTLLTIGIFIILSLVINKTTDAVKSKMDISVYFNDSASTEQIINLQTQVASRADVKEVKYISKEEALEIFKNQQEGKKVADLIDPAANPLPRSLQIKAVEAENLDQIAQFVGQKNFVPIIHNISYQENKKVIDRLINMATFIKKIGWIFSGLFILISILMILNTIRLTIFTRKDEIEIMRLVGANDSFIKVPFVIEGILYGLIATIISAVLIKVGMIFVSPMMDRYLGIDLSHRMAGIFSSSFLAIIGIELFIGIAIGVICSLISIRRHLRF